MSIIGSLQAVLPKICKNIIIITLDMLITNKTCNALSRRTRDEKDINSVLQSTQCIYNQQTFNTISPNTHTHTSTDWSSAGKRSVVCKRRRLPCVCEMVNRGCYYCKNMNYTAMSPLELD